METLAEKVNALNKLISQFRFMEALDQFYDEGVITVENEEPPRIGLQSYRDAGKQYLSSISNHSNRLKNVIVGEGISVTEWHYTFDHTQWGKWDRSQISVQRWKNGKIVHERHHYV